MEEGRVGGVGAVVLVRLGEGIGWGRSVGEVCMCDCVWGLGRIRKEKEWVCVCGLR